MATCFGMQCSKSNYDKVIEAGRESTSLMQHLDGSQEENKQVPTGGQEETRLWILL